MLWCRYEEQKREVEDLVLMGITHASEYEQMAKLTRRDGKCQRPKVCACNCAAYDVNAICTYALLVL